MVLDVDVKFTTRLELDYELFKGVSVQFDDVTTAAEMAAKIATLPPIKNMWPVRLYSILKSRTEWTGTADMETSLKKRNLHSTADAYSPHVMTQVDKLRKKGITGHGIKVAVIDTGVSL
ncbi:hypothetical protein IL306_001739 [Fusarium sp. DS 682]|nr:hypothetical protein IL306_001739 [Fusarium sp. DS 682]